MGGAGPCRLLPAPASRRRPPPGSSLGVGTVYLHRHTHARSPIPKALRIFPASGLPRVFPPVANVARLRICGPRFSRRSLGELIVVGKRAWRIRIAQSEALRPETQSCVLRNPKRGNPKGVRYPLLPDLLLVACTPVSFCLILPTICQNCGAVFFSVHLESRRKI